MSTSRLAAFRQVSEHALDALSDTLSQTLYACTTIANFIIRTERCIRYRPTWGGWGASIGFNPGGSMPGKGDQLRSLLVGWGLVWNKVVPSRQKYETQTRSLSNSASSWNLQRTSSMSPSPSFILILISKIYEIITLFGRRVLLFQVSSFSSKIFVNSFQAV